MITNLLVVLDEGFERVLLDVSLVHDGRVFKLVLEAFGTEQYDVVPVDNAAVLLCRPVCGRCLFSVCYVYGGLGLALLYEVLFLCKLLR